jgi:cell wall-associated NlpC family hydrolase
MSGFDCSGFVCELLQSQGLVQEHMTAQGLHDCFIKTGDKDVRSLGSLAFFGNDNNSIHHVGMCLNGKQIIEAAGGGRLTLTVSDAIRDVAFVKVRPIDYRKDLVAVIMPHYPI